jgi:hypothetical protein
MRFGVTVPNFGDYFQPRTLAALAHDAEAAGWEGFFLWDHVMFGSTPTVDPWIALSAVALATEHIRLGPLVTPLPRRRPVKLARETVSLDHLSRGRLILGVGSGSGPWEWENLGEPADMRTRAAMLDEGLDVLTRLWSGEPVSHHGAHYRVHVPLPGGDELAAFLPAPVQTPRIPIWVGGSWPNRGPFKRAARWDGVAPMKAGLGWDETLTPDDLRAVVDCVSSQRNGTEPFDVVVSGFTTGTDRSGDAATVAPYAAAGATWWVENVSPWHYGWAWQGPWPVAAMNARIRNGPPTLPSN